MEPDLTVQFVDEKVTRLKFEEQVNKFNSRKEEYRRLGIIPLSIEFPFFELAFLAKDTDIFLQNLGILGLFTNNAVTNPIFKYEGKIKIPYPSFLFAVRIDYSNFDVVPPSLRFINPITSEEVNHVASTIVIRPDQQDTSVMMDSRFETVGQNLLLHDDKGRLFICLRGLREYHTHLQHDGDAWELHRKTGIGNITEILDRLYLYSTHNSQ